MKSNEICSWAMERKEKDNNFYFTTTDGIGRYLNTVLKHWGYKVYFNNSEHSDSCYLKSDIGMLETNNLINVRVSNHPIRRNDIIVDYDVYAGYLRPSAISYVDLILNLAALLGQKAPERINVLRPGSDYYRQYKIELQRRAAIARTKGYWPKSQRFYV